MLGIAMADKDKKKFKYLSKTVKFGSKQVTLFSLDGTTWSSRKDELHQILARHEQERAAFNQMIGEAAKSTEEEAPGAVAAETENDPQEVVNDEYEAAPEPAPKASKSNKAKKVSPKVVVAAPKARKSSKPATKKKIKAKSKRRA